MSMYRESMTDDCEDSCAICLDKLGDKVSYPLSDKFGCGCKQKVHEECLTEWVNENVETGGKDSIGCIMCRQQVSIMIERPVIEVNGEQQRLREALGMYDNHRMEIMRKRLKIICLMIILYTFLVLLVLSTGVVNN